MYPNYIYLKYKDRIFFDHNKNVLYLSQMKDHNLNDKEYFDNNFKD